MGRCAPVAALLALLAAGAALAQPAVHLEVVAMDPPAGGRLRPGEPFYATVRYAPGSGQALVWFSYDAPERARAAWVEPARADFNRRFRELLAQGYAFWAMRGRWTAALWLPAVAMAGVYLFAIVGGLLGSNLAPIWIVFASPVALVYVLVFLLVRRRTPAG